MRGKAIRKLTYYATNNKSGLIAYALTITQEAPKSVETTTYSDAISYPNSSNWLLAMQEEI